MIPGAACPDQQQLDRSAFVSTSLYNKVEKMVCNAYAY